MTYLWLTWLTCSTRDAVVLQGKAEPAGTSRDVVIDDTDLVAAAIVPSAGHGVRHLGVGVVEHYVRQVRQTRQVKGRLDAGISEVRRPEGDVAVRWAGQPHQVALEWKTITVNGYCWQSLGASKCEEQFGAKHSEI